MDLGGLEVWTSYCIIGAESPDAARACAKTAAADHVCRQPVGRRGIPRERWSELAGALGPPAKA